MQARRCDQGAGVVADVDRLADERMPGLGEVDADLVGLAGLEPDLAQRRAAQRLAHADVRDRALALPACARRAAQAVAAIGDQVRLDAAGRDHAVRDADVHALHRVRAQLRREPELGPLGLREREQARRRAIDAMHDVQRHARRRLAHASPRAADQVHRGSGLALFVRHARRRPPACRSRRRAHRRRRARPRARDRAAAARPSCSSTCWPTASR